MVAAYPIEGCNSRPSYDDLPGLDGERLRLAATGSEIRRDLPSPPKAAQIAGKANARPRPNATSYDRDRDQFASSAQLALIPLEEQDVRLSRITRQAASMIGQRSHNIAGRPHAPPETHRVRSRRRSRKTDAAPCARPAAPLSINAGAWVQAVQSQLGHRSATMTLDHCGWSLGGLRRILCGPLAVRRGSRARTPPLTCRSLEPAVGFEPTTYRLQV
jgi:hypothetical protein